MAADNKLVAKNTLFLYIRMLATVVVGLYTYRLIINAMGLADYGIFGVIGDIVGILYMLNGALTTGSSRFITYALGEGDKQKTRDTFVTTLTIHLIFAGVLLLLGEGVGIWYINNQMVIDPSRIQAAQVVLQLTLLSAVINITQVPFTSLIVAHERMSIYAWLAIADALLKLGIAFALTKWGGDRLILYAFLILIQGILTTIFLRGYCSYCFEECVMRVGLKRGLFGEISRFVGWNMIQNIITALNNQGLTMLIAAFFSPVVIAARAIAIKVLITATQFITNFRQAMNPQIVKLYAAGEYEEYRNMVLNSAKFSFYIFWIMALPIIMNSDTLLTVWLGQLPEYASIFLKLSMIDTLFWLFDASFNQGVVATGDIKRNTLWTCAIDIARFPILYLLLRIGFGPVSVYAVSIISGAIIGLYIRPMILRRQAQFAVRDFLPVFMRCLSVALVSTLLAAACYPFTHQHLQGLPSFLTGCSVSLICAILAVVYVGMSKELRQKVFRMVASKVKAKIAMVLLLPCICIGSKAGNPADDSNMAESAPTVITMDLSSEASIGNGSNSPYYLVSNRHGILDRRPDTGYLRANLHGEWNEDKWQFQAGADVVASAHAYSNLDIHQLYVSAFRNGLGILVGRIEHSPSLRDFNLSSGSMVWSGNARPIPQIWFGTKEFLDIRGTKGWLQIKGDMLYGRYMDDDYLEKEYALYTEDKTGYGRSWITTDIWSHQKRLYLRTNPQKPWVITVGGEHGAQFGGHIRSALDPELEDARFSPTPADFLRVFIQAAGGSNAAVGDKNFKYGNHIGILSALAEYQWGTDHQHRVGFYMEDIFEDGSGIRKLNGMDGLWGIEYHNTAEESWISGVVLEYLQTTDQSGPIHWAPDDFSADHVSNAMPNECTGQDDYYNNYFYTSYAHYGMACGSPMLKSPVYNTDHYLRFTDNRVKAWHLGLNGRKGAFGYRVLASYRQSWGTYFYPNPRIYDSINALFELNWQHGDWQLNAGYAFDHGELFGNNQALSLRFIYHINLFK